MAPSAISTMVMSETSKLPMACPTFTNIPVLDFEQSQSQRTKSQFLTKLREALVIVGFFYLKNPPIPQQVFKDFIRQSQALCELPLEKKLKIDMVNSKHFLGYSRVGHEKTAQVTDNREIFDASTSLLNRSCSHSDGSFSPPCQHLVQMIQFISM